MSENSPLPPPVPSPETIRITLPPKPAVPGTAKEPVKITGAQVVQPPAPGSQVTVRLKATPGVPTAVTPPAPKPPGAVPPSQGPARVTVRPSAPPMAAVRPSGIAQKPSGPIATKPSGPLPVVKVVAPSDSPTPLAPPVAAVPEAVAPPAPIAPPVAAVPAPV
ncbi:MAG: hypothetical protein WCO60_18840, partial [Verrucomicrobiota bacterium]